MQASCQGSHDYILENRRPLRIGRAVLREVEQAGKPRERYENPPAEECDDYAGDSGGQRATLTSWRRRFA